ncbi:MAG: aminodeoxychorismate synthase component I [Myxococcales bacterium]|nr:aminodeoxychorismate synthase component I [Myxococcales bacterium]
MSNLSKNAADIRGVRVLLVDNYSSFSQSLVHYLAELTGCMPVVVTNDVQVIPNLDWFEAIVLSPGPGSPAEAADFGICAALLAQDEVPVLGICLGHQGLGTENGATLTLADEPYHGRCSAVEHDGDALFDDIPDSFVATRYHSLVLRDPLPPQLQCIARSSDGIIMGLRHRERPQWSVQFHPESIASEYGHALLANFSRLARRHRSLANASSETERGMPVAAPAVEARRAWSARTRVLDSNCCVEQAFSVIYGNSDTAFWLDGGAGESVSYMGDASGPHAYRMTYDVGSGVVQHSHGRTDADACDDIFCYLGALLKANRGPVGMPPGLAFTGGLVGYFGYELKGDLGAQNRHRSPWSDAQWLWVDRFVAYDHRTKRATLVALCPDDEKAAAQEMWLDETAAALAATPGHEIAPTWDAFALEWRDSPSEYEGLIEACQENIKAGESYELCLTTQLEGNGEVDALELFRRMRRRNPAPYSAFLRCEGFALASSSPERFLHIDALGLASSKPIKGTASRDPDPARDAELSQQLAASEKERAENLMIVDLVRHDLGHTCQVGSVKVDSLALVESFSSVHQLVSTIRGRLREDASPLQCVAESFPGGSMTGAPKKRSMEILDELESGPRGPYSGSIGYLSMNGAVDLSIVIRSVLVEPGRVHLGVGGAITSLSEIGSEVGEVRLKARAQIDALENRS